MSRQIQIRRGTADENDLFTGAIGEITMDTTNNTLRVHDGETLGGTQLAKKSDIPSTPPIPDTADFVIESQIPTAGNNYTWYRKYKSGWVEQGGYCTTDIICSMPIQMANTNYSITVQLIERANGGSGISNINTTSFIPRIQEYNAGDWKHVQVLAYWNVSGYAN